MHESMIMQHDAC